MTDIYLSGRFSVDAKIEKAWLKRTGCKHRCFSYAFVHKEGALMYNKRVEAALHVCEKAKINIMMDSGAHTLIVMQKASKKRGEAAKRRQAFDIEAKRKHLFTEYCKYVKANSTKWAWYVTLDFKQDQKIIYAMQQAFAKEGLSPVPVYHGDSSLDWLRKHQDMGHNFICIGGAHLHPGKKGLDYYLDKVFNYGAKHGLEYHGLALTSLDIIMSWPFRSVDSSTWSRTAAFGMIVMPDVRRRKLFNIHVSDRNTSNPVTHHNMTTVQKEALSELMKNHGFDLSAMHTSVDLRHDWNGWVMSNLDQFGVIQTKKKTWGTLL